MLRDRVQTKKFYHTMIGWNVRMDGFQGAILNVKLKRLAVWNEACRNNAKLYSKLLSDVEGVVIPKEANYAKHIYHVYAIRGQNRDKLIRFLKAKDIHCGIHDPITVHLQDAYKFLGLSKGGFPVA